MIVTDLSLPGVKLIVPKVFADHRGYNMESYSVRSLADNGIDIVFVQDNHVRTTKKGTLRGLHFQNNPRSQSKLVRCVRGRVLDYVVDLRRGAPTYKQWLSVELTEDNFRQILIPKGFGHAFVTLTGNCEVIYKVDDFYAPDLDRSIAWNDPEIGVSWPESDPILSDKDAAAPLLKDSDCNFVFEAGR